MKMCDGVLVDGNSKYILLQIIITSSNVNNNYKMSNNKKST